MNAGKSPKTNGNIEWTINTLRKSWKRGFDISVATILASDVSSWLARQNSLKPNSYNELSRHLKNIFELALNDRVISRSPYFGVTDKRKRFTRQPDAIPSPEQFERIVEAISHQRFADHAQDSADLASFLGLAASAKRRHENTRDMEHVAVGHPNLAGPDFADFSACSVLHPSELQFDRQLILRPPSPTSQPSDLGSYDV